MPTDNLALLQDGYTAFAAGDLTRLGELFAGASEFSVGSVWS